MLYLATRPPPEESRLLDEHRLGLLCAPGGGAAPRPGWIWAADNGCFNEATWDVAKWEAFLARRAEFRSTCLFATVPDVVGDCTATLARWSVYAPTVLDLGYRAAFVAQDGQTAADVPWTDGVGALFIGGSTLWKASEHPRRLAAEARERGLHVHVGRVNSEKRYRAWAPSADTADGTFLAFGPRANLPRLLRWIDRWSAAPTLWETR